MGIPEYVLLDIELRLRPDARSPAEARRRMDALRPRLDNTVVEDATLLLSEVVSNSVRHGGLDEADRIEVRIRGTRSMLHVDVIDPGPGFEPGAPHRSSGDGGWGLWLLEQVATRWGVDRKGRTRVWFELAPPVSTETDPGTQGGTGTEVLDG